MKNELPNEAPLFMIVNRDGTEVEFVDWCSFFQGIMVHPINHMNDWSFCAHKNNLIPLTATAREIWAAL
jgi:hypothetical protein